MSLQAPSSFGQFQPQSTGGFGGAQSTFGSSTQQLQTTPGQFQGTSNFGGSSAISPPTTDIFGSMPSSQNFRGGIPSTMATQGSSFSSQSSVTSAPKPKPKNDEFGVFQSAEKDAWSMGQGLGTHFKFQIMVSSC